MDGLSAEIPDVEKVAVAVAMATKRKRGRGRKLPKDPERRSSASFSLRESRWLYSVLAAVLSKDGAKVEVLIKDPIGQSVAQKAQRLKYSAETPVEGGK